MNFVLFIRFINFNVKAKAEAEGRFKRLAPKFNRPLQLEAAVYDPVRPPHNHATIFHGPHITAAVGSGYIDNERKHKKQDIENGQMKGNWHRQLASEQSRRLF